MVRKRIIILGAGLAGLSAAWHLQRNGIDCSVLEKEPEVGGLCRSKTVNGFTPLEIPSLPQAKAKSLTGFTFDYSGHLLHFKRQYTFNLVSQLLGSNLAKYERKAFVFSHNRFIDYPFQANLAGLPASITKECLLGFISAAKNNHRKNNKKTNFSEWINKTFGKGIAKHFMFPYNSKFWTVPPQELTCEWLDGFIPVPTTRQVIKGALTGSRREFGYNSRFWYPKKGGINQLPLALAAGIKNIYTNSKVEGIDIIKKELRMTSGDREKFDCLISTIPLPELPSLIKEMPEETRALFKKLRWNSIFNLNLGLSGKNNSERHWIYFPDKNQSFFRVGFPDNFSSSAAPPGKNSLYAEAAYSKDKPVNKSKILARMKEDLKKSGLIAKDSAICAEDINDIKYGYPIYDKNYSLSRETILQFLSKNNIIPCGRYGSWRYLSMEDTILDGQKICLPLFKKYC